MLLLFKFTKSTQCCQYVLMRSSYQLSIPSQQVLGHWKSFPCPCCNFGWLDLVEVLCTHPQLLWVCVCNCRPCLQKSHPVHLSHTTYLLPFLWWVLIFVGKEYRCPLWHYELHSFLLSIVYLVVNICINHYLVPKEVSLMTVGCYTNLWFKNHRHCLHPLKCKMQCKSLGQKLGNGGHC